MKSGRFIWITVILLLISNALCVNASEEELIIIPKKNLLTFSGKDLSVSDLCEAMSHHGFLGLDAEVVAAVASWIKGVVTPK